MSYKGINETERLTVKEFLKECIIVDINSSIKEHSIKMRKKYVLKLPDCIIAATSLHLRIPIITADKEFSKMEDIEVILYQK